VRRIQNKKSRCATIWKAACCLIVLLLICALWPLKSFCQTAGSALPQQSLTLQEYIAALDRCSAVLNASPVNSAAIRELRVTLPANWTVTAGEAHYSVSTAWLTGALGQIEKNPGANGDAIAQAQRKLQSYREEAQALEASTASQNLAQSRARLDSILSAREFRGQRGPSWLDVLKARVWSWIVHQLERVFGRLGGAKTIGNVVAWTVIVLACLLLLFWTLRFLMRGGSRSEMDLRSATPVDRDWHRWLRDARAAAARGDYRAAIHAAYWAAIVRMEETNTLPEDRSRTPRESLRLVRLESADYAPLLQLTQRFELVWYGYRSATDADWSDAMQQLETLGCLRSSTAAISGS
jgi:hypothetical protein